MELVTSPLAPEHYPALPNIDGVQLATAACGVRYQGRDDVLLVHVAEGTQVAGVFTKSRTAAAPVLACQNNITHGKGRVLLVNSGNANAFTGGAGVASVARVSESVCELFDCPPQEFFMASTGVIGEPLPDDKITAHLHELKESLSGAPWEAAAHAIMTTDTFPKMVTRQAKIGDVMVTINGIAKGSGMIAPDMATMLGFIFTDAAISADLLQEVLSEANVKSFNSITVDGDTSTSDTVLAFATGAAGNEPKGDMNDFARALHEVMFELAMLIVRDGEGAEKLVEITVTGAEDAYAARNIALSIGNSPLVKTALAASDANWGRIVMAVGKAGEAADRDKLAIIIGGVSVAKEGMADPEFNEADIQDHMDGRDIKIAVDVGVGMGMATIYTCDLTHRYIDINAGYRT